MNFPSWISEQTLVLYIVGNRVMDPDWLNTDPDPAFLLNPDPDPDPDPVPVQ
jgi:hypothetical protein